MKRIANSISQFRNNFKRLFGRQIVQKKRRCPLTLERLESRELLAASFFAPAEPAGSVNVELDPLANVTAGVQQVVTFGVPFTRGSVSDSQLSQIRVLKNGVEIPAFVQDLTPWRSIDDPAVDGQSVRVARIQIPYTFTTLAPETITVQWGGPARTLNITSFQDPRLEWHTVTSGSFVAADNVQEPNVLPVLPAAYLALGMLDSQTDPTNSSVAQMRDDPAVMDAATFTGYTEYDSAEKNFFYTIVNQNGGLGDPIDYKTQAEPWLYDRSAGMYDLYFRSGFANALQEAVRSTEFYVNHLDPSTGFFDLKPGDPKYAYNESLAYTYWLLGDDRMLAPISTEVNAYSDTETHWTPQLSFWTERNTGDKLLAAEIAYEVTGGATFKAGVQTIVGDLIYIQNGANGQLPANRVDGGLYHYGFQHDLSEVSSANVIIASSWMSAMVVDPMVRIYGVWEDNAQIPDFIVRMGNFEKAASKTDTQGEFGGTTRYPDYLMRADGTSDNRSDTDVQHAMDVGAIAAWATYFADLRGTPDASLRQLANDLYATYSIGVNDFTSVSDGFSVAPPRKYNWEYKNSASFSWAMTADDAASAAGMLRFSSTSYSVVENQPVATITVTRTHGSTGSVSVHYATSNGTATAGSDYSATSGTLTFADGETSKAFTIPINNDTTVENLETVVLTLSNATGGAALDSPGTGALTIDSDDTTSTPVTATFQQGVNGYAGTTDADFTNQYGDNGSNTTTASQLGVYQLTGTGGYTIEGLIRFGDLGITTHATNDATITSASLTLTVDFGPTASTIRGYYLNTPWSIAPGTDLGWLHTGAGTDWAVPGALGQGTDVIAGTSFVLTGTGTQTVTVNLDPAVVQTWINNPNSDQGFVFVNQTTNAVSRIFASETSTAAQRPKLSVSYTVAPTTFPGSLQFSNANYSVNENGGTATITMTRTGGTGLGSVSVHYATSDGTATAGSDYTAASGTLTFAAGETIKTFTIPIFDDNFVEFDESINLTLSNPTGGAALGSQTTALLTIFDNDVPQPGVLQFSTSAYSVSETAGTATVTVTRTGGSNIAVDVDYATSNGTAIAGSDYTATSGTLSFVVGETSKTFTIPILDDNLVEVPETVHLTLRNPTNNAALGSQSTATLTILSDDTTGPIATTFQQGANGYTGTTDVAITSQLGGNGASDFTGGTFNDFNGTTYQTEGLIRFSNLGIPAGSTINSASLTLSVSSFTNNPIIRGYYVLAPWSGTPGTPTTATQLGWIHRGTGQDWASPGALGQGTDLIAGKSFVLTGLNANGGQTVTVSLDPTVVQSWIDNPNADQGILLVNQSGTSVSFDVDMSENATASSRPMLGVVYTTAASAPGTLQFSAAAYNANENQGAATVTVTRTGGGTGSVSVNYATSNGTATAGSDYTATSGMLTFAAGETSKTFTVPITNDTLVEGNETVNLTLGSPTGGATLGSQTTATLTIVDDDVAQSGVLQFSTSGYTVNENQSTATITVTRTGGSNVPVSVNYATSNGTATAGSDYTATSGTLTFAVGETSKTFTVPIIDDAIVENPETVTLTLSNPTGGATLGSTATATLTIISDDTGNQPVTVALQQGVNGYTGTTDASITTQNAQFTGGNGITTFGAAQLGVYQTTGAGSYTVEDLIRFSNLGIPASATVSGATLTVSVENWSGNPTIRGYYLLAPWSGTPGANTSQLGWIHRGTGQDWATQGALGQGTDVVAGKSFVLSGITPTGVQTITINLDPAVVQTWINNPSADQGILLVNETTGAVVRVNTAENATVASRPKISVTYTVGAQTPQPGTLQFSNAGYSVNESGGTATVTVTRTGGSTGSVSVNYATSNGTATAGSDYTTTSGTLTFADGETSKTFTVPITNDTLVEGNETVNLTLSSPTGGATLGSQTTATLTIVDDDVAQPGVLQFSTSAYSVNENQGTATITITRTGGSNVPVSVNYATSNGTATAGSDYTAASGTLTFAIGETSKTFTVPITNDTLVEGNETVNLTLSSPTGGATLGSQTTATLTVVDDDVAQPGVLQFSTSAYSVNENQGTATITVTRTGGSNVPVSVNYATSNGTATAGSDYTAASGTLNFAIGETSKTFTIPILDDALVEGNETVNLMLSSPAGGATLGNQSTATLIIIDNDTTGQPTTATFQQGVNGYTGTTDASITTQNAQFTGGNGLTGLTDTQMGLYQTTGSGIYVVEDLIRFSNLGIPTNATASSASITINLENWAGSPTIRGYYVLAPWNGAAGSNLGWLHTGAGQDWAVPGAGGQGSDVVAGDSFVIPGITATGPQSITINLDPAVVQTWINNPNADQGILLVNQTPGAIVHINASENATVASRPKLSISYTVGAQTPQPGSLQFSNAAYSVNENGGTATITVARTGGSTGSVSVNYATSNGTATAGSDYTATSGTLIFANGETSKTFTVPITNDTLVEGNETINLTLSNPTGGATLGSQTTAVLTIQDDDVATLQSISVAPVNPSLANGQTTQFTATGHYSDGSTQVLASGVNWSSSNTSIVTIATSGLASAVGVGSVTITAMDGSFTSSTTLTVTAAAAAPTVGANTVAFVPFNSPAGVLSTNPLTTQASGSTVLAWVGRGAISTFTSAAAPTDNHGNTAIQVGSTHSFAPLFPNSGMALYTFPSFAGGSGDVFTVPMPGPDEVTVMLVEIKNGGLIQDSQWNQISTGPQTSLSVTTTGPATLVSFWTGDSSASAVTAVPNNGFTVIDSQLLANDEIEAAVATKDVSAAGTYNVTWTSTPQQTGYIWLVAVQHANPVAHPGTLQLSSSSYSVNENQGAATITVNRTGGSDGAVAVHYATSNGTATAGSDYTATSGTLTFAAGETSKTFTVPIIDDALVEGNETVNLTLGSPTGGATLGSQTTAALTIIDNDTAPAVGAFTNVTDSSGITAIINQKYQEDPNWWLSGEHLIDLDNDGNLDLFLDSHTGGSVVALNDGHGHFTRVTTGSWPDLEIHEMFDVNGDGKVDINATYGDGGSQWWINNSTPGHVNFTPTSVTRDGNTSREQVLFDFNGDGKVDWFRSAPPGLVVDFGDGNGGFTAGSVTFPIAGTDSNNNASFLPGDFDGDGKIDLLVLVGGNYDGTPGKTLYWHNNGNMTFTDVTASSGLPADASIAKGVGDFNQDGKLDIIAVENKSMPPVIYLNDGHGRFTKKANAISGMAPGSLDYTSWGTAVVTDIDNDGIPDIIMDGKYYLKVLRGAGGGNFTYMNTAWGITDTAASAVDDGLCFGDIDGDGRLDVIGYNETYPTRTLTVYHNDLAPQHYLNVRLDGLAGNTGAAGATISIFAAGTNQLLWSEQVAQYDFQVATSYYGYDETERHFGLGNVANVDVVVQFPSGRVTRMNNVAANQTIRVLESAGS